MAVTCGFFNALEHDRLYDAIQMSSIFDGIIRDGIFSTIGTSMAVTASGSGLVVNVGAGRAWFNHTWILNDTLYPVEAEAAEVVLDRIDALVIEVNQSAEIRDCSIKFIKGTPSSRPVRPTMIHNAEVNQYALAYVSIRAGQTTIFQADITSVIGNDETPFVTGLLQQTSIESIVAQWQDEFYTYFNNFRSTTTSDFNTWMAARVAEYNAWYASMEAEGQTDLAEFDSWFQEMKDQLSEDAAGHLQAEIDALELSAEKGSVVIVTTSDDTLINHACTISQGASERNATFDINRTATFESVPFIGDMHITSTNGTLIANKDINIPYFGRYNYDLEFWEATLAISSSSTELYERPITITKGGTTVGTTSFDNTGHATFKVHEPGTYTVTSTTTGGVTFTANVVVTEETSYPVDLGTPIGKTALPTDDIQLWIKCGSEYDCDYTTLAEVLADPELFARLCADSNACDYMARSTTWASTVCANATAMQIIGMFDYCANALLENSTWCEALAKSEYYESVFDISVPKMTSNTAPSGTVSSPTTNNSYPAWYVFDKNDSTHASLSTPSYTSWVQYDFGSKKNISAFSYCIASGTLKSMGLEIKYSDDNSTFYSAGTYRYEDVDNNYHKAFKLNDEYGEHRYWRLIRTLDDHSANWYSIANTIQFYGRTKTVEYTPLVPVMTSNTTPSGECISSYDGDASHPTWHAFDNNESTYSMGSASTVSSGQYIGYVFPEAKKVRRVGVYAHYSAVVTSKVQYSDDGTTWEDTGTEFTLTSSDGYKYFDISDNGSHRYWRLLSISSNTANYYPNKEVQFYAIAEDIITIHSAANDTIYYMDGQTPVTLATTDANGRAVINAEDLDTNNITLYSTIAKNPDNLSNAYSKSIKITKYTTEIYLMPILALYWWGYMSSDAEELSTANGWTPASGYTFISPTYNTNSIRLATADNKSSGVAISKPISSAKNIKAIAKGNNIYGNRYGQLLLDTDKVIENTNYVKVTENTVHKITYDVSSMSNFYFGAFQNAVTRSMDVYALWYE